MADLVTLQQYKDFAGLQSLKNDARINIVIDQVSELVKSYCGSTIIDYASNNKTEYFNLFFLTGVFGGFTTFSQFSYDVISLQNESNLQTVIYIISSILVSILLAFAGIVLANRILK